MTQSKKIKIHLAPLQGYTDAIYRNTHNEIFGGIDTYYTPFVRLEKGTQFRVRELRDIAPENNHVANLVPQMIASTPEELKIISELFLKNGYTRADLNMGCPFPMLVRRHKGSGLLQHPDEVEALLKTMETIPELKFSVKMRLGWEDSKESEILIPLLNEAPLVHIGVHARLGKQQYKGDTDKVGFKTFYEKCKHPLFYNGDIKTVEDIISIQEEFPNLAGVMIGRGLLANPSLAYDYLHPEERIDPLIKKRKMRSLHDQIFEYYQGYLQGEKQLLEKMKPFWEYLSEELEKRTRKKIEKANKLALYETAVYMAFSQWGKVEKTIDDEDSL